ncbi:MAG: hypothetical protein Q8L81_14385 [Bacteroidota bacterium]|nr:hypothetical protein [Bacteroidota bacterium]
MKFRLILFNVLIVSFFGCKKDKDIYPGGGFSSSGYIFVCDSSLTQPVIGWQDTTADKDKDVQKILYNPINSDEVIYIVKSKNYYNEMYLYNRQTKVTKSIDKSVYTMPSINKFGWLTYCKANFCVYKIKANGDSLIKLTNSFCNFPRWDYTGDRIFYTQEGFGNTPSRLMIVNKFGVKLDSINGYDGIVGISSNSNKIVLKKSPNYQLFLKDLNTGTETTIRYGSYNYNNLTFDNNDANVFWWDNNGIYRLNINNLKEDTLVKTCPLKHFLDTPTFELYATNVSPNSNKLTFILRTNKKISTLKLLQEYHALEMDLYTETFDEIKLFQ